MPFDIEPEECKKLLAKLVLDFWSHHPSTTPELSTTVNFVLRGKGREGRDTFSLFFGGDHSESGAEDFLLGETLTIIDLSDLDSLDLAGYSEREISRQLDRTFQSSDCVVEEIVNRVLILRAYRESHGDGIRRGRQVRLF